MRGASTLKSVSRRRSLVGRVASPAGAWSVRDRSEPAITRMNSGRQQPQQAYFTRFAGEPLQLRYARLVNPDGSMDGRGIEGAHLLPAPGCRVPGSLRF